MATLDDLINSVNARQDAPNQVDGVDVNLTNPNPANAILPPQQTAGLQLLPSQDNTQNLSQSPVFTPMVNADQGTQGTPFNYNNSQQARDVNSAVIGEGTPRGGSANPGIYGLLPANLQHGTLRNVLGALGDAFLVGSGHQAQYEPRMERQEVGQAMAGYNPDDPDSVQAAIQRVASTGAPGSTEMADQLQKNYNDIQLRKQIMEQNNWYKQQMINDRNQNILRQMSAQAQGDLSRATSSSDYAQRLARWDAKVKALDPSMDAATAFAAPAAADWKPGALDYLGMTSNQQQQASDKEAQRKQSQTNAEIAAGSRVRAAGIGAGAHESVGAMQANKPTEATMIHSIADKVNKGIPLQPGEQAIWNRYQHGTRTTRSLPAGLTPNAGGGPPAAQHYTHVAVNPHGNKVGWNGQQWVPIK